MKKVAEIFAKKCTGLGLDLLEFSQIKIKITCTIREIKNTFIKNEGIERGIHLN